MEFSSCGRVDGLEEMSLAAEGARGRGMVAFGSALGVVVVWVFKRRGRAGGASVEGGALRM